MRVSKPGTRRERLVSPKKAQRGATPAGPSFSKVFEAERVGQIDLVQALEEVEEYARRLRESPVYENLLRYKGKVRTVLRFLVQQSYVVTESSFYDPQGRRRLLMMVESIDQKLEELTRDFLSDQTNSLDLVGRLDEIRGLLLDLYS